jgi:hypothetical protein
MKPLALVHFLQGRAMRMFYTTVLWATLSLVVPSGFEASFAGGIDQLEKGIPQGQDPPGADNGQQPPPSKDKEVIPPPPVGDDDIYTDAPNPDAGHEEEVIPPSPTTPDDKSTISPP